MAHSPSELPDAFYVLRNQERRQGPLKLLTAALGLLVLCAALFVLALLTPWTPELLLQVLKVARSGVVLVGFGGIVFLVWWRFT